MEFGIFFILFILFAIAIIFLNKLYINRLGKKRGQEGEELLYENVMQISGEKKVFKNIFIPKKNGSKTELDLILINSAGIHVMESKNVRGYIIGSETDEKWEKATMKKYGLETDRTFQNPIKQNSAHIRHLASYLKENSLPYYSYIVYSDEADLTKVKLESDNHIVCHYSEVASFVSKRREEKLKSEEIASIASKLAVLENIDKEKEHKMHVRDIRSNEKFSKNKKEEVDYGTCPECGSPLRKVTYKKGKLAGKSFLGCSSFPICKHKQECDR